MYLRSIRSLLHVMERSAFMAKTSPLGMMIGDELMAESSNFSLSCLDNAFTSDCSCSLEEPMLTNSLTHPTTSFLLFRVLAEAAPESTLGVVSLTTGIGCKEVVSITKFV